jgi:hypothetical protein
LNFVKNHFITAAFKSFPAWEETPPGPRLPRDVIEKLRASIGRHSNSREAFVAKPGETFLD